VLKNYRQMIDLLSLALVGVLLGVLTGIVPGIHPNTVIFSSLPIYISTEIEFLSYAALIAGLSVSHTFHDFLPSIYLQAPDANTALSTMPGAEKAAAGEGPEAFHSTLIGGLTSVGLLILALPVLALFLDDFYSAVRPFMAYIVAFFLFFLIFREKSHEAVITSVLAGTLGIVALNSGIGGEFILMPVFAGLFAVPAVFSSLRRNFDLPEQEISSDFEGWRGASAGLLSGLIAGTVPGVGAAGSTTFLSPLMDNQKDFLAGMGAVNTIDIIISFLAILSIGKARSGAAVALQSLSQPVKSEIYLLIGLSIFCAGIAALLALRTEKLFLKILHSVDFRFVLYTVILVLLASSFVLVGWFGVLTLLTASLTGFYSLENSCRVCCMAVLLIPSILFFI
jgi:putative membrane protein